METETMTTADETVAATAPNDPSRQAISEAESVLDGLLDVVRGQAEGILDSARSEATAEREAIVGAARAEAAEIIERSEKEAAEVIGRARRRLEEAMAVLGDTAPTAAVPAPTPEPEAAAAVADPSDGSDEHDTHDADVPEPETVSEVDPDALRVLARELGSDACREVVETFLAELTNQLDYLTAAATGDDEDDKKVGRTLHNLSSGCATVGAFGVAKLCNTATAADLADHIDQLVDRGEAVRDEVERLVAEGLLDS